MKSILSNEWSYARIFWQLVMRDLYLLKKRIGNRLIDSLVIVTIQLLVYDKFMPLMGMPKSLIVPIYIGAIIYLCLTLGQSCSMRLIFDLHRNRFLDYHLTLPMPKRWLFAAYVVAIMIELACITLPLLLIGGLWLISNHEAVEHVSFLALSITYFISLVFMGIFFLRLSFAYSFTWFFDNVWPRRLSFMLLFGAILFTWKQIYALSLLLGIIFLCNPFTYITEGLRTALLNSDRFLSLSICLPMLFLFILLFSFLLAISIKKRLDPV